MNPKMDSACDFTPTTPHVNIFLPLSTTYFNHFHQKVISLQSGYHILFCGPDLADLLNYGSAA